MAPTRALPPPPSLSLFLGAPAQCFERNAEGMLKNMAIHELALLATYYDVTVENIKSVTPDAEYSEMLTLTVSYTLRHYP